MRDRLLRASPTASEPPPVMASSGTHGASGVCTGAMSANTSSQWRVPSASSQPLVLRSGPPGWARPPSDIHTNGVIGLPPDSSTAVAGPLALKSMLTPQPIEGGVPRGSRDSVPPGST